MACDRGCGTWTAECESTLHDGMCVTVGLEPDEECPIRGNPFLPLDALHMLLAEKWKKLKANNLQAQANEIAVFMNLLHAGRYEVKR